MDKKKLFVVICCLAVVVVVAVFTVQTLGGLFGTKTDTPVKTQKHGSVKPGEVDNNLGVRTNNNFERTYDTTFFYSKQQIGIVDVKVIGLQKHNVIVRYVAKIVPANEDSSWINKSNFSMSRGNFRRQAKRVTLQSLGAAKTVNVTFKVPRRVLQGKLFLNVLYPKSPKSRVGSSLSLALSVTP